MKIRYIILFFLAIFLFPAISANAEQEYWGSRTSTRYHYPTCKWADKITLEKRLVFRSPEEARKAGYNPCPVCKPPLPSAVENDKKEQEVSPDVKTDMARPTNVKNILFITAASPDDPVTSSYINAVKSKLDANTKNKINYSYEYLNPDYYNPDHEQTEMLISFLKQKYQSQQPDMVIAHLAPLINKYADAVFPKIPVIYSGAENDFSDPRTSPYFISFQEMYDFRKAVQVIFQLQPEKKKIYIVLGDSEEERLSLPKIATAIQEYRNSIEFVYLNTKPFAEILKIAKALDDNSVILYVQLLKDFHGKTFIPGAALQQLHQEASAPIYAVGGQYIGKGSTGGYVLNRSHQGAYSAGIAAKILNGTNITDIHAENISFGEYVFDWRELKHWKIKEENLPPGSVIEYKQYTLWDLYKWQIIALLIVVTLLALVLILMISKRKKVPAFDTSSVFRPQTDEEAKTTIPMPEIHNDSPRKEEIKPVAVTEPAPESAFNIQPDRSEPPAITTPETNTSPLAEENVPQLAAAEPTEVLELEKPATIEAHGLPESDLDVQLSTEEETQQVDVTEPMEASVQKQPNEIETTTTLKSDVDSHLPEKGKNHPGTATEPIEVLTLEEKHLAPEQAETTKEDIDLLAILGDDVTPFKKREPAEALTLEEKHHTPESAETTKEDIDLLAILGDDVTPFKKREPEEALTLEEKHHTPEPSETSNQEIDLLAVPGEDVSRVKETESAEALALEKPDTPIGLDSLTGFYDHRKMEKIIHEEVESFQSNAENLSRVSGDDLFKNIKSFSLIIGAIDPFQNITETYGAETADRLLISLAADFPKFLRSRDVIARWQNDEFLFLLPEITLNNAKAVAERIRKNIEEQTYPYNNSILSVTMTFGVSTIHINETANDLLKRVNNTLYKGKNMGGNCVVTA